MAQRTLSPQNHLRGVHCLGARFAVNNAIGDNGLTSGRERGNLPPCASAGGGCFW